MSALALLLLAFTVGPVAARNLPVPKVDEDSIARSIDDALHAKLHLLPVSYDVRDAHFGCASTIVNQARGGLAF